MAEVSTLTPSPPAMTEQPVSSHPLPSESPKTTPIPKSALYGDRAVMGNPTLPAGLRETAISLSSSVEVTLNSAQGSSPSAAASQSTDVPMEADAATCLEIETSGASNEPLNEHSGEHEPEGTVKEQQMPSSPGHNPSANPHPSASANNPTTSADAPPHYPPPPVPTASENTENIENPSNPNATVPDPQPEGNKMPLEAQQPTTMKQPDQNPNHTLCQDPQPNTSSPKTLPEPPFTPSKIEPPSLIIPDSIPSLALPSVYARPAPDTLSYLESASLMSGTLESLSGLGEDGSSVGSDSEINGQVFRRTDKYGFLGGAQYTDTLEKDVSVEVARHREMKWLDMFQSWDKWISRRFPKVKLRCRKGIPSSLRARAWQLLSSSEDLLKSNPGKFEELEREQGDPKWLDIIEKDLHRQFPFHEMFAARGGHGQQDLYRILKAYTIYRPDEGYCQAQAPVAAVLLMHMPAEQAFWCLVQICERYLPGYYSAGLEAIQLDGEIFFSLLRRVCPMAYRHLKKFKIDPILYMTEWFMCIFSRTLPWASVLRVWDMFFCEGVKIVFRVGLVLLKQMLGSVDKLRELQGMYETMERLRNIPPESIREDLLVQEVITLPVTEALIERECSVQVRKWRESRGELTHQPGRRLHGTRAIHELKRRAASISSGGSLSFLGSYVPPPGPLRASSSLLSLPGFRKSKTPFSQAKKGSFSGASGQEAFSLQGCAGGMSTVSSPPLTGASRPPLSTTAAPPGSAVTARPLVHHGPSPLASKPGSAAATAASPAPGTSPGAPAPQPGSAASTHSNTPTPNTPNTLQPAPKVVSEQVTPTIPSPMAVNAPLPPCTVEDEGKNKKKKSKEDKKKEKEEEKQKLKDKKEREKQEKERVKKEKERSEKEKKKEKGGKKKEKDKEKGGGPEPEEKNGAAASKDS
ncbi:TBC1 domain family member 10B [Astyanax mexicanus]|uniref:TBC1 domain family member 10B n=1 Tax=Astyanax mexicanus TaxID=7994 RepID=A0A8T2KYT9_ASTMX|nr:TBC1 domain family member 10B [Astyanax mexicanus]